MASWEFRGVNRKVSVFDRLGNRQRRSNETMVESLSFNVYVTGFPTHLTLNELRRICERHGKVNDAFIATKLSKMGKPFGFVRFNRVENEQELIDKLCNVYIGKLKLHANRARFNREGKVTEKWSTDVRPSNMHGKSIATPACNGTGTNTYASILKTGMHTGGLSKVPDEVKPLHLDDTCLNSNSYRYAAAGCMKEFNSLPNLRAICDGEGFDEVVLRYLGGYWVMIQFKSEITRDTFLMHKGIKSWFEKLHKWNGDINDSTRVVWVDIEGIPTYVWSKETFSRIAKKCIDFVIQNISSLGNSIQACKYL